LPNYYPKKPEMKRLNVITHKVILSIAILIAFSLNSALSQNWLPNNYWTFDGINPLADSINRDAMNPAYFQSAYSIGAAQSGKGVGKYLSLNSGTKLIVASDPLAADSGFTVEMLIRPGKNLLESVQLLTRRDGAINIRFGFPFIRFGTKSTPNGSSAITTDTWDINLQGIGRATYGYYVDGNWHHLVFKYDAKNGVKEVWVDGQLPTGFSKTITPGTVPLNSTNTNNNVCDLNTMASYYQYIGDMDEIAMYTYALPGNMIYKHFQEFSANGHYSFSNSTITPPAAAPVSAGLNMQEFAPGHPTVNVDAVSQLKAFPNARFKPGNTLFPNVPVFNPAHIAGYLISSQSVAQLVPKSLEVQKELVKNFNYTLMVTSNTGRIDTYADTNQFDGAWIRLANQNPSWKTSANTFWPQVKPKDAGFTSTTPYIQCGCLPASSFMRNASGQFLDEFGNVSSMKVESTESPLDSLRLDGLTQKFYLDQLTKKMTRPLNLIFENGEAVPRWTSAGLLKDPAISAAYTSSGLGDWGKYMGKAMFRMSVAYTSNFLNLPALSSSRFVYYQIDGNPAYSWNYAETRQLNSLTNGQYQSSGDIYLERPKFWRYWAGPSHGWQFLVDSRFTEITLGDKLFSPTVSAGWDNDEEIIPRPAQWLGFLKAVGMTGAENFNVGYFVTKVPYQLPEDYVWQFAIPGYAQGLTSRYEDILRSGFLLPGDVPNDIINKKTQPGYSFYSGDMRKLVVGRKHDGKEKYVFTGTIQPNDNMVGNAELSGTASIKVGSENLSFNIRRQGSTYIYDKSDPSNIIFYQLDGWHENTHPFYWSKDFNFEAELFDNTGTGVVIKTEVPAGTTAGDYTNFTSYIKFNTVAFAEYNFTPRGSTPTTHYLWVKCRVKPNTSSGFTAILDGNISNSVTCVTDTAWTWYRFDALTGSQITYNNLSLTNHKLSINPTNTFLEIDQILVTIQSGNVYSNFAAPCNATTAIASITPNGPTSFCAGSSVTLTANTGTAYLWSTGATTQSIVATTSGNFTVTVTSSNGTATSSPTAVTVNARPTSGITASGPTTFCTGGNVTLSATGTGASYVWSNGSTNASINVTTAGNYTVTVTNSAGCSTVTGPTTVTVNTGTAGSATISAGGATTFCAGGSVSLSANTGASYLWSNGATTKTIIASSAGSYLVTVIPTSGCPATSTPTIVTTIALPTSGITANGPTTFCSGGSVTLTSNSTTGTYLWSNGATTRAITASSTGNYTVTVTGSNGCQATTGPIAVNANGITGTATITSSGATSFCQGGSVVLTANTGSSYLWSTGATTQSITANASGSYIVTVTPTTGCTGVSAPTAVTVNTLPTNGVSASGPTTFCNGGSVTLTSNLASGTYLWSNGATTRAITASTTGNYTVTVTGTNGCRATSTPTAVNASGTTLTATITAAGATTFCQGGSVNLTATAGASYLWSNGATTRTISATSAGSYVVTVTPSTGCAGTSTPTLITVNTAPTMGVTASGPTTFCIGGSVNLSSNSSTGSYLWSTGATTKSITASTTGNYTVTVTGSNGCKSTTGPTAVIASGTTATPTVTTSGATSFCVGDSVVLTASSGSSYLWSNGATSPSITAKISGNYTVNVTQIGGCSATSAVTAVNASPGATFTVTPSGPLSFCNGSNVKFNVSNSTGNWYIWYRNNIQVQSSSSLSYTATTAGIYILRAQLGGCGTFSQSYTVTVPCREGELNVGEMNFNVYPNPFMDQTTFAFELAEEKMVSIRLYDLSGKLVDIILNDQMISSGETKLSYNASNIAQGIYVAEIIAGDQVNRVKISSIQ